MTSVPRGVWAALGPRLPAACKIRVAATCRDALEGISDSSVIPAGPCCDRVDRVDFADVAPSGRAVEYMAAKIAAACEYVRERDIAAMLFVEEELLGSSYLPLVRALRKTLAESPPPDGVRFAFRMPYRDDESDDESERDVDLLGAEDDDRGLDFEWDDRDGERAVYTKDCSFDATISYRGGEFEFRARVFLSDRSVVPHWRCKILPVEVFAFEGRFVPAPPSTSMDRVCERVRALLTVHEASAAASGASSAALDVLGYGGDPFAAMIAERFYDPSGVFAEKRIFETFSRAGGRRDGAEDESPPAAPGPCRAMLVASALNIAPRPHHVFSVVHDMIMACEYVHQNDILRLLVVDDPRDGMSYVPAYRALRKIAAADKARGKCGHVRLHLVLPAPNGGTTRVDVRALGDIHFSKFDWTAGDHEAVERAHLSMRFDSDVCSYNNCKIELRFYFDGGATCFVEGPRFRGVLEEGGRWTNPQTNALDHPKSVFDRVRSMLTLGRILSTVLRSDAAMAVVPWVYPQTSLAGDGFHLENRLLAKHAHEDDLWRDYRGDVISCHSYGIYNRDNDSRSDNTSASDGVPRDRGFWGGAEDVGDAVTSDGSAEEESDEVDSVAAAAELLEDKLTEFYASAFRAHLDFVSLRVALHGSDTGDIASDPDRMARLPARIRRAIDDFGGIVLYAGGGDTARISAGCLAENLLVAGDWTLVAGDWTLDDPPSESDEEGDSVQDENPFELLHDHAEPAA